jgi:hypothetical protein
MEHGCRWACWLLTRWRRVCVRGYPRPVPGCPARRTRHASPAWRSRTRARKRLHGALLPPGRQRWSIDAVGASPSSQPRGSGPAGRLRPGGGPGTAEARQRAHPARPTRGLSSCGSQAGPVRHAPHPTASGLPIPRRPAWSVPCQYVRPATSPSHRFAAGHGYRVLPGEPPGHPELIQDLPAQRENVAGFVREQVPRILVPGVTARKVGPYPVSPAIAVRVEQTAGKSAWNCHHNGALPWP